MQETKGSAKISDLTLTQLVQLQQGLGRDIDKIRTQREQLKGQIDQRLARGERESSAEEASDGAEAIDAAASGAVLEVKKV